MAKPFRGAVDIGGQHVRNYVQPDNPTGGAQRKATNMKSDASTKPQLKLDPAKLFGFRNLRIIASAASDLRESADLAFTKKGTETSVA